MRVIIQGKHEGTKNCDFGHGRAGLREEWASCAREGISLGFLESGVIPDTGEMNPFARERVVRM